jgi:hypothetical protein
MVYDNVLIMINSIMIWCLKINYVTFQQYVSIKTRVDKNEAKNLGYCENF